MKTARKGTSEIIEARLMDYDGLVAKYRAAGREKAFATKRAYEVVTRKREYSYSKGIVTWKEIKA